MYLKEKKMQDGGKYIFGTLKQSSYFTYTTSTLKQNGIIEKFYHSIYPCNASCKIREFIYSNASIST